MIFGYESAMASGFKVTRAKDSEVCTPFAKTVESTEMTRKQRKQLQKQEEIRRSMNAVPFSLSTPIKRRRAKGPRLSPSAAQFVKRKELTIRRANHRPTKRDKHPKCAKWNVQSQTSIPPPREKTMADLTIKMDRKMKKIKKEMNKVKRIEEKIKKMKKIEGDLAEKLRKCVAKETSEKDQKKNVRSDEQNQEIIVVSDHAKCDGNQMAAPNQPTAELKTPLPIVFLQPAWTPYSMYSPYNTYNPYELSNYGHYDYMPDNYDYYGPKRGKGPEAEAYQQDNIGQESEQGKNPEQANNCMLPGYGQLNLFGPDGLFCRLGQMYGPSYSQ